MEYPSSYVAYGGPGEFCQIWGKLFSNTTIFDVSLQHNIYFTLIGDLGENTWSRERSLALFVTIDSRVEFKKDLWYSFKDSLRKPYIYDEEKYEVKTTFGDATYTLNIYNLIYAEIHRHVIIGKPDQWVNEYYKSGTMLTFGTAANTYGDSHHGSLGLMDPGPISRHERAPSNAYNIKIMVFKKERNIQVVPSMVDTWA
ncbi:hypothetical protein TruAng_012300 [Truncatella angustata]|nr:hypothetical protein TruAng_012300 [Truncatella angustata]